MARQVKTQGAATFSGSLGLKTIRGRRRHWWQRAWVWLCDRVRGL